MGLRSILIGLAILWSLQASPPPPQSTNTAQDWGRAAGTVRSAIDLLGSNTVARVDILYLPVEISTRVDVSPQELERIYRYRIEVKDLQWLHVKSELASALERSAIRPATTGADLRWGCIFYDASGARVLTMYFDRFGKGLVNGVPVTSNGELLRVLERRCSCLWAGQYDR